MEVNATDFIASLESLINDVAQYFMDVEMADMPSLDRVLTPKESKSLAYSFTRTKMTVPSRSPLLVFNKQTAVGILSWMAAPVDYLSNLFRKFPDERALGNYEERSSGVD